MRPAAAPTAWFLLPLLAACGSGGSSSGEQVPRWTVADAPLVSIGGTDDRPDYLIQRLSGATRLSDGRIVVADAGASEVRVYGRDGSHVATHGGEGQGPGELRYIFAVRRGRADTVLVLSRDPGLSWVHADGGVVRQERFITWSVEVPCRFSEGGWHLLPDARMLFVFEDNPGSRGCPPLQEGPHRNTALLALLDRSGALDSIEVLPSTARNGSDYRVYGHMLSVAVGEDRFFAGDTEADSIRVYDFSGRSVSAVPTPFQAEPVPASATTVPVRHWTEPNGTEHVGAPYVYPPSLPRFGRLVPGPWGSVWVMKYPDVLEEPIASVQVGLLYGGTYLPPGGSDWRVLDADGEVVAEVRLPERFFLLEAGEDYVLGVTRDAYDVESVVLHDLRAGAAP